MEETKKTNQETTENQEQKPHNPLQNPGELPTLEGEGEGDEDEEDSSNPPGNPPPPPGPKP